MYDTTANGRQILVACAASTLLLAGITVCGIRRPGDLSMVAKVKQEAKRSPMRHETSPQGFTAKQVASVREFLFNDIAKPSLFYASIAVKLPRNCSPFSPLYWLQVWHRPPWGITIIPVYSSSDDVRPRQLIFDSEDLRHVPEIWERVSGAEMPDVATPYQTLSGVLGDLKERQNSPARQDSRMPAKRRMPVEAPRPSLWWARFIYSEKAIAIERNLGVSTNDDSGR